MFSTILRKTHVSAVRQSSIYLCLLCLFLLGLPGQVQAQSNPNTQIYLPLIAGGTASGNTPKQSSLQLIAQAVQAGQLTEAQALMYRVQAVVGDAALPAQYHGNDAGLDGSTVMAEIVAKLATLPAATQAQLQPYLLPPSAAGSWIAAQTARAAQNSANADWDTVGTANGKVKIWYHTAVASHAARAVAIAKAIDTTIWPQLTNWLRAPLPDCGATCAAGGGDSRIDIYITNVGRSYTQPFTCCNGSAGFAIIRPDTSFAYVARTLAYLSEYAYPIASLDEYKWLMHASAQYAMHYVYPTDNQDPDYPARNQEQAKAGDFLYKTLWPLETVDDGHEYGAYLLPFFMDDPSTVPDLWAQATMPDSLANIDSQLQGGLREQWPHFAVENWNHPPVDGYKKRDDLSIAPDTVDETPMTEPGEAPFIIDAPHLSAYYLGFTFPKRDLKRIAIFNPIAGAGEPSGALWAIMKIDGTWRAPQDWTTYSHQIFCRDEPDQNLEQLILVISNSEWKNRQHELKTDDGTVRVSPTCGGHLSGTFTLHHTEASGNSSYDQTTVVNVKLRYDETANEYLDDGSTFTHNGTAHVEGRNTSTGELGYITEWSESGSGAFTAEGTQIKGSVGIHDTEPDETWVGAIIKLRKTGATTYYPSGDKFSFDGEEKLTLLCNNPTGVRGLRNENGVFDLSCTMEANGGYRTTVSGSLYLE